MFLDAFDDQGYNQYFGETTSFQEAKSELQQERSTLKALNSDKKNLLSKLTNADITHAFNSQLLQFGEVVAYNWLQRQ